MLIGGRICANPRRYLVFKFPRIPAGAQPVYVKLRSVQLLAMFENTIKVQDWEHGPKFKGSVTSSDGPKTVIYSRHIL